jgi:RimJ/RimL family protein N-acetyltransferase
VAETGASTMPEHLDLGDGIRLHRAVATHAPAVARAVTESLEHLQPFMPWAQEDATRRSVQHQRLITVEQLWDDGREHQYAMVAPPGDLIVGMIGVMRPDRWSVGRDTAELGYWVHVDWCNRGIATRASRAVTGAALALAGVERIVIAVDEANGPSNAVPRKLGFEVATVVHRAPTAPGESGRLRIWVGVAAPDT